MPSTEGGNSKARKQRHLGAIQGWVTVRLFAAEWQASQRGFSSGFVTSKQSLSLVGHLTSEQASSNQLVQSDLGDLVGIEWTNVWRCAASVQMHQNKVK